jgi:hypothetical protein
MESRLVVALSFDQSVTRTGPFSEPAKLMLRFEPVVAVMPMAAAASLPNLIRTILYFLLKGERQLVCFEVLKPFVPRYRAKARCPGKIEANAGATIVQPDRRWT